MAPWESTCDIFLSRKLHLGILVTRSSFCAFKYIHPWFIFFDSSVSYGRPGVELSARHQQETVIQELHFLPEQVSNWQTSSVDDPSTAIDGGENWGCVLQGGAILNEIARENSAWSYCKMLDFCHHCLKYYRWQSFRLNWNGFCFTDLLASHTGNQYKLIYFVLH